MPHPVGSPKMHPPSRGLPLEIEELMAKGMDLSMEPGSATERAPANPTAVRRRAGVSA